MREILIAVAILVLMSSCRSTSTIQQVPVETRTVIHQRQVPVFVGSDSALIKMLLTCDSSNQVILQELSQMQSTRAETSIKQRENYIEIFFKTVSDTIYVPVVDTMIITEKPLTVEKKVVEYKQKAWQERFMWIGVTMTAAIACWGIFKIWRLIK